MTDHNTEQYYRDRAGEYEAIYYRDDPIRQSELAAEAERLRKLAKGRRVLEFACGTGYWTRFMSETAVSITAVDLAAEMLAIARRKLYGCPVEFVEADLNHYPATPQAFDLVALGFWFSHHRRENYDRLFSALRAPLAHGGTIWMIDNNPPDGDPRTDHTRFDTLGNNYKYRYLNDGRRYEILKNYFTESDLRGILEPHFRILRLTYGRHYWSVELSEKSA